MLEVAPEIQRVLDFYEQEGFVLPLSFPVPSRMFEGVNHTTEDFLSSDDSTKKFNSHRITYIRAAWQNSLLK